MQWVHFLWVGGVSTITDFVVLVLAVERWLLSPEVATIFAFVSSLLVSYVLNRRYTFCSDSSYWQTFPRYVLVTLFGLLLNVGLMFFFNSILGVNYLWGFVVITFVVPLSNFFFNRSWTFV